MGILDGDTITEIPAGQFLSANHRPVHAALKEAVESLRDKVGKDASTPVLGDVLVGTATGASAWRSDRVFDVRLYGATGSGTGNDATAIQAAIDAADAAGGGVVYLPNGTYRITSSLIIASQYGIGFVGPIGSGWQAMASGNGGAILDWHGGAAPMVVIRPAVGSGYWNNNHRVENLALQGNNVATQCIHVEALKGGVFRNINMFQATDVCFWVGGTSVSGYLANQHTYQCVFENLAADQAHGSTGRGFSFGQTTPDARFFFNTFVNVHAVCTSGIALDLFAVDHCTFMGLSANTLTTNPSVVLNGQAVNYNVFVNLWPGIGGVYAKGTEGGAGASGRNTIFGYSTSDSAPLPVIGRNAGLTCYFDSGRPTPSRTLIHVSNGTGTDYYVKLASGQITTQYDQQSGSVEVSSYAGNSYSAHVDFKVYMASAINGSNQPTVEVLVQQKKNWVAADFSIVVTNVTTTVDWELWVKLPGTYTTVMTTPQVDYSGTISWLESQTPVSARTAGTSTAGTSV